MERISYNDARKLIKDGDIIFTSKKRTLSAYIIRFFTKSDYSHVGFAFWMEAAGEKRLMMAEAQGGTKRRIVNMSFYKGVQLDVVASPKDWSEVGPKALEKLGEVKYGWLDVFYIGFREFLLKRLGIKIPRSKLPGEICSEYVAKKLDLPKQNISPQILWEHLEELGHKPRCFVAK